MHEAYLRLVNQRPLEIRNRVHFFAISSRLTREILVDHARKRRAAKRGYGCQLTLNRALGTRERQNFDVLALDDALRALGRMDAQQARIVELRFLVGCPSRKPRP